MTLCLGVFEITIFFFQRENRGPPFHTVTAFLRQVPQEKLRIKSLPLTL